MRRLSRNPCVIFVLRHDHFFRRNFAVARWRKNPAGAGGLARWAGHGRIVPCRNRIRKFRNAGLVSGEAPFDQAELVLYNVLRKEGGNAYGRYNSLIRELVSFGRALAHWQRQNP